MLQAALEAALREALGNPELRIVDLRPVGGGCIHSASRIVTTTGDFFAKWNAGCPPDLFLCEADGLREMARADSGLVIPEVVAASALAEGVPGFIVMEYLESASGGRACDERLGQGLAALHRRGSKAFGFPVTTYCGSTPQDNTETASWPTFYAERRLGHLLGLVGRDRGLSAADHRTYERLIGRLGHHLPADSPPSLIHGDLWSGNVMMTARGPALFDPACTYADRELEFGITTLFGGFSERFWSAYQETWPLPPGWRERNPLYQLYHLLNHYLIFGGHYGAEALAIAKRFA
jgi:protein-ribulosamine 3-kinase